MTILTQHQGIHVPSKIRMMVCFPPIINIVYKCDVLIIWIEWCHFTSCLHYFIRKCVNLDNLAKSFPISP